MTLPRMTLPGELVNSNLRSITNPYVRELGFFVVRLHPSRAIDEWNDLRSRRHQLTGTDLPFAHAAVTWRRNLRIAEVHLRYYQACFFGAKVGGELHLLRLEDDLLTPLGFGCQLAAAQHGSGLGKIGVAAGVLTREPFFISNRLL